MKIVRYNEYESYNGKKNYPKYLVWESAWAGMASTYFLLEIVNIEISYAPVGEYFDLKFLYRLDLGDGKGIVKEVRDDKISSLLDIFKISSGSILCSSNDLQECIFFLERLELEDSIKKYNL